MSGGRICAPALAILSFLFLVATACDGPHRVQIPVNGAVREALYWEPSKRLSPAVLLVAPPGQQKESWVSLGTRLRQQGYGVLALELSEGDAASDELRAAFEWMRLRKKVDAARIGVVGADEAANTALEFAAHEPLVRALVLLSPTLEEPESTTEATLRYYGFRPILLTAAEEYPPGASAVWHLGGVARGETEALLYSGLGVPGAAMLREFPWLEGGILGFFDKHL